MKNEEILKTGISEDIYNDNVPQQFNSIEEIDKSFDNSEENIKSDNNDIPNQFNSIEEIDKSFNEKETPVNYTLEISEDDENIIIEPKIGNVNCKEKEYKPVYKGKVYVKKNEKTNEPEIYADTDYISQELSDNKTDDNWFVRYISIFSNLPKDVGLSLTDDLFKKTSKVIKYAKLSGGSFIFQILPMTIDILANKDKKGTKKAIVTTTVRTGAVILFTGALCLGLEIATGGAATPYIMALVPIIVDYLNFALDKQISEKLDSGYDKLRIIYHKTKKSLKFETTDSKKLDNLINYLKKDEFKEIFSDIIVEDITKKREEQAEKIAKRIFENKISLLQDEDKSFKQITKLYKHSNKTQNPQKLQREIVKACKKADDMLIERLKAKYGEDIKISIDYSNCPDIISEYI